ncbi:MAG: transposase, partial [Bacteroidia bacterium]|nr:transposase [Bacteroidia bacterium]
LLDQNTWQWKHFGTLYHHRWGIETAFFTLKSFFQAAVFSAYTLPAVEQDLWALFCLYNLQSMCIRAVEKQRKLLNEKRTFLYQINRNVGIGLIRRLMPACFLDEVKNWYAKIHILLKELLKHLEPKRSRPGQPRKSRLLRGTERHYYESNYKSAL